MFGFDGSVSAFSELYKSVLISGRSDGGGALKGLKEAMDILKALTLKEDIHQLTYSIDTDSLKD